MQKFVNNFTAPLIETIDAAITYPVKIAIEDAVRLGQLQPDEFYILNMSPTYTSNPGINEVELMKVTQVETGTGFLTVERGYEGTTPKTWVANDSKLDATVSAETADRLQRGGIVVAEEANITRNIVAADRGTLIRCTNSTSTVQISIPQESTLYLEKGFRFDVLRSGTSEVQFIVDGADTTEPPTLTAINAQYDLVSVIKLENDSGSGALWGLFGNLKAAV